MIRRTLAALLGATFTAASLAAQVPAPQSPVQQPAQTPDAPRPAAAPASLAQQARAEQRALTSPRAFRVALPHSHNPFAPYMASDVPPLDLRNSPRLQSLVHSGKLYLSLNDALALALENNLDLAYFRYNLPIAETDLARTRAGGQANGVNVSVQQGTPGGNGSSFSAGSTSGGAGSANSSSNGSSTTAGGAGGLVTSTLGAGTQVRPFDPVIYAQSYTDHKTQQLTNAVTTGVPVYQQNTIYATSQYLQYFPLGTSIQAYYTGLRQTKNSIFNATNPTLESSFQFFIFQPLLAGFGLGTNTRYIHIAKNNKTLTDLGFQSQVIATITQVENIYWDLVNAYEDEQVRERSLAFAQKTLEDDRKQLELQAIPAMQVVKDEADVATREGDLTVARATLKLNELYMKNVLTKTVEDAALEDMPVIPLDRAGRPDDNADAPVQTLIAEAEKNRPDVAMDQIAMEIARISLRTIRNELLPTFNLYGEYAGVGYGGVPNPLCAGSGNCPAAGLARGFGGAFQNTFNYTSPEYQVGFELQITLRNRIAKADQFRSTLEFRQRELQFEEQKKNIRFDVRNSQFALQQARAHVEAARKARDLAQKTFNITQQEQQLGARSSFDTLSADHDLAVAESALVAAQTTYEKAKVDIDRAVGTTLAHSGISIDDARTGVVTHLP